MTHIPELNDLVRVASSAQEAFDNWDGGKTYGSEFRGPRHCTLDDVVGELDAANLKLAHFVLEHGDSLIATLSAQAGEAGTAETVKQGSVHEHAVGNADAPKGESR